MFFLGRKRERVSTRCDNLSQMAAKWKGERAWLGTGLASLSYWILWHICMKSRKLKPIHRQICDPAEVALKTFFLGPQAENGRWLSSVIHEILSKWFLWRKSVYPEDGHAISKFDQNIPEFLERQKAFEAYVRKLCRLFENEMPKFSPRYMGHMFSEISTPALLGHFVTLLHNPNNISMDASRVGVHIEDEAIGALLKMIGYDIKSARGHFTSGGTIANYEALIRARIRMERWLATTAQRKLQGSNSLSLFEAAHVGWNSLLKSPNEAAETAELEALWADPYGLAKYCEKAFQTEYKGPVVLVSDSKHYSWEKGVTFLGLGKQALWGVELDRFGRMSVSDLEKKFEKAAREQRPILLVSSVAGSTERGTIDDVHLIANMISKWSQKGIHLWHHVDAAYGGFLRTIPRSHGVLSEQSRDALHFLNQSQSITLDPHKLGYVPYSSGAFLCKDQREYSLTSMGAPYIAFHNETDRGPLTLEGSRSAGGAAATWMTAKCIGFNAEGYGRILERTVSAASRLETLLKDADESIRVLPYRDANVVCFCIAKEGEKISKSNAHTLEIYNSFSPQRNSRFMASKTILGWDVYHRFLESFVSSWNAEPDADGLMVLRLCLMNPFYDSHEMNSDLLKEFVETLLKALKKPNLLDP